MIILKLCSANISSWWHIIQCTNIVKINTTKIGKTLKVEINLSVLKFMHLGQFLLDSNKLGSKIKVRMFLLKLKKNKIVN